jgi:serine/threonine protein kinase
MHRSYSIEKTIAKGSTSSVHLGRARNGHRVAIKIVEPGKFGSMDIATEEAKILEKLKDVDTAVDLIDFFPGAEASVLVLEYLDAIDVSIASKECKRNYIRGVTRALADMHTENIVHADVKPSNFLRTPDGVVAIDFGLSCESGRLPRGIRGTPLYIPPEAFKFDSKVPSADIWALGVLAYSLETGRFPHDGETVKELLDSVSAPMKAIPSDPLAADFCNAAMAIDPLERPSAFQLLEHPYLSSD